MKTPREILLEWHQAAEPRLDAICQSAVAAVCDRRLGTGKAHKWRSQTATTMVWHLFWRELIFPCRRIWASLAVVWVLLAVANFSMRDSSRITVAETSPTPEMIVSFRQQEKILAELIGPTRAANGGLRY